MLTRKEIAMLRRDVLVAIVRSGGTVVVCRDRDDEVSDHMKKRINNMVKFIESGE